MTEIIFKYPGQKFVGIATRNSHGTLNHEGFTLADAIPREGDTLFDRKVVEVLTGGDLLQERSRCALNQIEAVAVVVSKTSA